MHDQFKSKRATWWLGGMALLVLGILAAAVILPATTPTPGAGGPDVHVPKMENVPGDRTPKMRLELEKKK